MKKIKMRAMPAMIVAGVTAGAIALTGCGGGDGDGYGGESIEERANNWVGEITSSEEYRELKKAADRDFNMDPCRGAELIADFHDSSPDPPVAANHWDKALDSAEDSLDALCDDFDYDESQEALRVAQTEGDKFTKQINRFVDESVFGDFGTGG
jgi:hypothetical protein